MVQIQKVQEYEARDYSRLLGTEGFSDRLLRNHFKLYEGYVKNTNKALARMRSDDLDEYAANEVRRRFVWEFNGVRLHELYFDHLRKAGSDFDAYETIGRAVKRQSGSREAWEKQMREAGELRGIGWVCFSYDPRTDRSYINWINEHDAGLLAGTMPLVVMDVWEHAFMVDYDTDKGAYMDAFFDALDWGLVERRYEAARSGRAEDLS